MMAAGKCLIQDDERTGIKVSSFDDSMLDGLTIEKKIWE